MKEKNKEYKFMTINDLSEFPCKFYIKFHEFNLIIKEIKSSSTRSRIRDKIKAFNFKYSKMSYKNK